MDPVTLLDLRVRSSFGNSVLDLSRLSLAGLDVEQSSGDIQLVLPAISQTYDVALEPSSGAMRVTTDDGARVNMTVDMSSGDTSLVLGRDSDLDLRFNGSSGQFTVELPAGLALKVEVRSVSSGDVKLPSGLARIDGGTGDEGTWETQGYAGAEHKVNLIIERMSSGSVVVRQDG